VVKKGEEQIYDSGKLSDIRYEVEQRPGVSLPKRSVPRDIANGGIQKVLYTGRKIEQIEDSADLSKVLGRAPKCGNNIYSFNNCRIISLVSSGKSAPNTQPQYSALSITLSPLCLPKLNTTSLFLFSMSLPVISAKCF
jgi:hypothetical protein